MSNESDDIKNSELAWTNLATLLDVALATEDELILQISHTGKRFKITIELEDK